MKVTNECKKRILMIEDHPLIRKGMRSLLEDHPLYLVSDEAQTAREANEKLAEGNWDLILLDLSLPDGSGFDILKDIRSKGKNLPVVIMTMHNEEPYLKRAMDLGADGFVVKDMATEQLLSALERIDQGGKFFSDQIGNSNKTSLSNLSTQEIKVMKAMVEGKSLTLIGQEMGISVKTVSTYRTRVLQKLGVKNNAELVKVSMTC